MLRGVHAPQLGSRRNPQRRCQCRSPPLTRASLPPGAQGKLLPGRQSGSRVGLWGHVCQCDFRLGFSRLCFLSTSHWGSL